MKAQDSQLLTALLVIDLDGFKAVNDTAGHGAGDNVLRGVATSVQRCLRISDSLARFGGDEFAVLLGWLQSPQDAMRIAENITNAVAAINIPEYPELSIGASAGMNLLRTQDSCTIDEAIAAADSLMYTSKKLER